MAHMKMSAYRILSALTARAVSTLITAEATFTIVTEPDNVLEQARAGVYSQDKISKLPKAWVTQYFDKKFETTMAREYGSSPEELAALHIRRFAWEMSAFHAGKTFLVRKS